MSDLKKFNTNLAADQNGCFLCPRSCAAQRTAEQPGWCGANEGFLDYRVASIMPHFGEESIFCQRGGSGTVFFSGCSLKCCFCQNYAISQLGEGQLLTSSQLIKRIGRLLAGGIDNINLVTPSHYADRLPDLIRQLQQTVLWQERPVPIIWNSSAYETVASLEKLAGLIDIYLVDIKFSDQQLAAELCAAPDYPSVALAALAEMIKQQARPVFGQTGLLKRGVVIRHLVLPGLWQDSYQVLAKISQLVPLDTPLSLLSQYAPPFAGACSGKLANRLDRREYKMVLKRASEIGFRHILSQ